MNTQSLARGLAFFSVGLGLAELLAPRPAARAIGVDEDNDTLLRLLGLRELGAGLGLMQGNPAIFTWARAGGDVMDLSLLASALRRRPESRTRLLTTIGIVAGVTAVDVAAAIAFGRNPGRPEWRVERDRRGIAGGDPRELRDYADQTMSEHQSGHLANGGSGHSGNSDGGTEYFSPRHEIVAREDAVSEQFGEGD